MSTGEDSFEKPDKGNFKSYECNYLIRVDHSLIFIRR